MKDASKLPAGSPLPGVEGSATGRAWSRLLPRWSMHRALTLLAPWLLFASLHAGRLIGPQEPTTDFRSFYVAARVLQAGGDPYDAGALGEGAREAKLSGHVYPYLYPPVLAQALGPLAALSPGRAARLWNHLLVFAAALTAAAIAWTAPRRARPVAIVVAALTGILLSLRDNVEVVGQVNLLLAALIACAFQAAAAGRGVLAGALLGPAIAVKLTPVWIASMWLARARWRPLVAVAASLGVTVILSLSIWGALPWQQYFAFLERVGASGSIPGLSSPKAFGCFSLMGFFMRLGLDTLPASRLSTALSVLLWLPIAWSLRRSPRQADPPLLLALSAVMVMSSPYVWFHHFAFMWPAVAFTAVWLVREERQPWSLALLAVSAFCGVNWPLFYRTLGITHYALGGSFPMLGLLALYGLGLYLARNRQIAPSAGHAQTAAA